MESREASAERTLERPKQTEIPASEITPRSSDPSARPSKIQDVTAPPCFFSRVCRRRAEVEQTGRAVCRECAQTRLHGAEYPLRGTAAEPLYLTGRAASEALDMVENMSNGARRRLRGGIWS